MVYNLQTKAFRVTPSNNFWMDDDEDLIEFRVDETHRDHEIYGKVVDACDELYKE